MRSPGSVCVNLISFPIAIHPAITTFSRIKKIQLVFEYFPVSTIGSHKAIAQAQRIGAESVIRRCKSFRLSSKFISALLISEIPLGAFVIYDK